MVGSLGSAPSVSTLAPDSAHSPTNETKTQGPAVLERVHSFSVNKQQVSIVQVNSNTTPALTLNSSDHPDIQYADSEDVAQSSTTIIATTHGWIESIYFTIVYDSL